MIFVFWILARFLVISPTVRRAIVSVGTPVCNLSIFVENAVLSDAYCHDETHWRWSRCFLSLRVSSYALAILSRVSTANVTLHSARCHIAILDMIGSQFIIVFLNGVDLFLLRVGVTIPIMMYNGLFLKFSKNFCICKYLSPLVRSLVILNDCIYLCNPNICCWNC